VKGFATTRISTRKGGWISGLGEESLNIGELNENNIKEFGEYVAVVFEDREYTNVTLNLQAERLARGLHGLGMKPGGRLGLMMGNAPEVLVAFRASYKLGTWAMPILFVLQPEEIAHILDDSGVEVCIVHEVFRPKILEAQRLCSRGKLKHIITADVRPTEGYLSVAQLIAANEPGFRTHPARDDDVAVLLYTSGTTGMPKGVMLSHHNLIFNAKAGCATQNFKHGDVSLAVLPLNHSFGIINSIGAAIYGTKWILLSWFDAGKSLELIERYRCTNAAVVPTMLAMLLNHPDAQKADTSSMDRWIVSGAPLPMDLYKRFEKTFHGKILEGYGLTEASPAVSLNRWEGIYKPGSAGQALPGVEVTIQDDLGNKLPPNTPGEICVRGPNVMKGYFNKPEATAKVIVDGWLHTGDVGLLDEEGYLFLTERKKDMIIRGGENIYPRDIEEVLFEHPGIAEAAVIGREDPIYGEEVCAIVVKAPGAELTEQEVIEYAGTRLAKFQKPKWVVFVDALPKNPLGKILKKELRARYGK
jgi:long-chain acyl-CoA synthetase